MEQKAVMAVVTERLGRCLESFVDTSKNPTRCSSKDVFCISLVKITALWLRSKFSCCLRRAIVHENRPSDRHQSVNDWSISASRACQDLVVAVEEVSQRMKAMMDREQSIRHVFELWRIKESRGRRWREREREHISMTRCAEILGIELQ